LYIKGRIVDEKEGEEKKLKVRILPFEKILKKITEGIEKMKKMNAFLKYRT
jgi:hypothetical protein